MKAIVCFANDKKSDKIEMEQNNTNYFVLKAILTIALTYSLLTIFEHFSRWFIPVIDTPFYH